MSKLSELFPKDEMFINCFYSFAKKAEKIPDNIVIVSKDKNGEKHATVIKNPEYSFYVTKDILKQNGEYKEYLPFDECKKIWCKYNNRYAQMCKATNNGEVKQLYDECIKYKDYKRLRELDLFPEFHSSDINIEDYYIKEFLETNDFEKNSYGIDIAGFDIEVDGADYSGFPDEKIAPCPVNMITYFNIKTKEFRAFYQKYDTDTYKEFKIKERIQSIVKSVRELYEPIFGSIKVFLKECKDELEIIESFFNRVNKDKPDYVTAWNARFDILTLHNRLIKLLAGTDYIPEDIMCPSDFPIKGVYIKLDDSKEAKNDIASRFDSFKICGWSIWVDHMCLFANITKPTGKRDSYSLDAIGLEVVKMQKENLNEEETDIKTACYDNYSLFFKYSMIDTLLLSAIVIKTQMIDQLHTIALMTRTRPSKSLKKTVCLRNFAEYIYNLSGYTISNNHSYLSSEGEGIDGAWTTCAQKTW